MKKKATRKETKDSLYPKNNISLWHEVKVVVDIISALASHLMQGTMNNILLTRRLEHAFQNLGMQRPQP